MSHMQCHIRYVTCGIQYATCLLAVGHYMILSQLNPCEALKKEVSILHNYYKPEMEKIYNMIYPELPLSKFCQDESRFLWLKTYLCETES